MAAPAPKVISFVGLPGSGKSTVGLQLARRLRKTFTDTDRVIEARLGCSIAAYFEQAGEARFRDIESEVLAETIGDAAVLATGGGIVLREQNRELLRRCTVCVYLRSSADEVFRRLRRDTRRPLLQVSDPLARLRALHDERDPLYRDLAHFVIETGRPSVPMLVNMVLMQLELAGIVDPDAVPSPVNPLRIPEPDPVHTLER